MNATYKPALKGNASSQKLWFSIFDRYQGWYYPEMEKFI